MTSICTERDASQQLPLTDRPQIIPLTVQLDKELIV